jgi:MFS family permease
VKTSALAVSGSGVMAGLGTLGWGWLVEKFPVRFVFMGVALVIAIAIGLFPQADTMIEALAYAGLFGVGVAGMLVVPPVAYADYFGRGSLGAIRGVTETFVALGQAIGAVLSGYIFDSTGTYLAAFYGFAVLGVITIVLLLLATPPGDNRKLKPIFE